MRGLMSKPSGEIMETPVKSNFKEGLSVFEYFISTHGARKGQADTALKTANSGYLTRRLVDVAQDVVITKDDCGALGYVELVELREAGDVIYPLAERAFGRIVASDAKDPVTGEMIVKQGEIIDKIVVDRLSKSSITKLFVKSLLTCQSKRGACAKCYGMDLSTRSLVDIGATVGIVAAQSIGEPGTQLTMRTFHIGGIANVGEMPYAKAKHDGTIQFNGISIVKNRDEKSFIVSRKASIAIISKDGRVLQDQPLDYGTEIFVTNGQTVKVGEKLAEWDSNNKVLLSEKVGTVKFIDLKKNLTYQDSFNEVADITNKIVISHKGDKYQPALVIEDNIGEELAKYFLPTGSYIMVENGQKINLGDILIKIPVEAYKTKDITGGLPRIAELFEARAPKDPAIISDIDGIVEIGGLHRGMQKVIVSFGDQSFEYLVPRGKQLNVSGGDKIKAGDLITSGEPVLQDILRILGPDKMQTYLVSQIQKIYILHGIGINDRHIEVIVRQMLRKVRVTDPGESDFLVGDKVDRIHLRMVNAALQEEGKRPAVARPVLQGITMASLGTESMFSAASFQETTRILAEAAIQGQEDHLYGLKENVIIGKLIPAGTGISSFRDKYLGNNLSELETKAEIEERL